MFYFLIRNKVGSNMDYSNAMRIIHSDSNLPEEYLYSIKEYVELTDILKTQTKLSLNFVVDVILNSNSAHTRREKDITIDDVLNYQTHLTRAEILSRIKKD